MTDLTPIWQNILQEKHSIQLPTRPSLRERLAETGEEEPTRKVNEFLKEAYRIVRLSLSLSPFEINSEKAQSNVANRTHTSPRYSNTSIPSAIPTSPSQQSPEPEQQPKHQPDAQKRNPYPTQTAIRSTRRPRSSFAIYPTASTTSPARRPSARRPKPDCSRRSTRERPASGDGRRAANPGRRRATRRRARNRYGMRRPRGRSAPCARASFGFSGEGWSM